MQGRALVVIVSLHLVGCGGAPPSPRAKAPPPPAAVSPPGTKTDDDRLGALGGPHPAASEGSRATEQEAATDALRTREERACSGLTEADAEAGPLVGGRHAFTAQPLIDYDDQATVYGVVLAFDGRADDADGLQALSDCHRARLASRGASPSHECPLDDPQLAVMIAVTPRGLALELRSEDPAAAKRAWDRAKRAASASRRPQSAPRSPGGANGS